VTDQTFYYKMHKVTMTRRPGAPEWVVAMEYPAGAVPVLMNKPSRMSAKDVKKAVKAVIDTRG
jgi:hypothetical protein